MTNKKKWKLTRRELLKIEKIAKENKLEVKYVKQLYIKAKYKNNLKSEVERILWGNYE